MHICFVLPDLSALDAADSTAQASQLAAVALAQAGHAVTLLAEENGAPAHMAGIRYISLTRTTQNRREQLRVLMLEPDSAALRALAFGLAARDWLRSNAARPVGATPVDVIETPVTGGAGALLLEDGLPPVTALAGALRHDIRTSAIGGVDQRLVAGLESTLLALADAVLGGQGADAAGLRTALGRDVPVADDADLVAARLAAYATAQARRRARLAHGFAPEGVNPLVSQLILLAENASGADRTLAEFDDSAVARETVKRGLQRTGLLPVVRSVLKR